MRKVIAALWFLALIATAWPQTPAIDAELAGHYFSELQALSDRDAGKLWGVRLYGPTMFVDPATRRVIANQADKEGRLLEQNGVYLGQLPPEIGVANTDLEWAGVHWTMVMWPLPQNGRPRGQLMAHESFHRLQKQLELQPQDSTNNHLDGRIGRIWLQVEWRALTKALACDGDLRRQAVADALYFRAFRRSLLPKAALNENRLEINEGLAEYTGVKLSARYPQQAKLVAEVVLWQGPNRSPFVRSFAYVSGPAYGILLDESGASWRHGLTSNSDLGAILAQAYRISISAASARGRSCPAGETRCCGGCQKTACNKLCKQDPKTLDLPVPTEADAETRAQKYDGDEIIAFEKTRELRQQKIVAEQTARLIDNPVLILQVGHDFNLSFDPDRVTAIDDDRSVYDGDVRVTDNWGILSVNAGALFVRENGRYARVQVPAPENPSGTAITGQGWKLELKAGWKLVPGQRSGDWIVQSD